MKKYRIIFIFTAVICLSLVSTMVSAYVGGAWTTYSTNNSGIASNDVRAIGVDGFGAMWFGTVNGLSRFDGKIWETFTTTDKLAHNTVNAIAHEKGPYGDELWVATDGGVSVLGVKVDAVTFSTPYTTTNSKYPGMIDHPEYFSLVDGKRLKEQSQLCCTNEEVIRLVTEGVLKVFREHPEADLVSVSQNDWYNSCECPKCVALSEAEGTRMAPVLALVNRVAEAVEKEFPGKSVETLAYQWTRKAPKTMRPRPNVVIRLCTIECCFSHPLRSCESPRNQAFASDLRDWAKVADRLWIWNYNTSFAHYFIPFPDLRSRADNVRFFVENHVRGIFQQDIYSTGQGELSELSGYLNAKLLWNPQYDPNIAIDEFLEGVYGPASKPIREYIDMLHDRVEQENIHIGIWQGPDAEYLTDDILARAD